MYINAGHSRLEFLAIFSLIVVILWQPAVAQSVSLPECTVDIEDNDGDGSLDNDGAGGIIDIDKDGDGLIELCDLEGIDRIRYQLDGTGYRVSAGTDKITSGCPDSGCLGYELVRSLDFADADSYGSGTTNTAWTTGAGWSPIGDTENPFSGVFLANAANNADITISNLTINRPDEDYVGLFSVTDGSFGGRVLGLRLLEVDIKGRFIVGGIAGLTLGGGLIANSSVEGHVEGGDAWVGGLIGSHYGSIINSYAKGVVKGHTSVGGLVGYSFGPISNSYAMVDVEASAYSGGLVGYNHNRLDFGDVGGRITNSYATGSVRSSFSVGGLVGHNDGGIITDVYASGRVVGSADVGGLVGYNDAGGHISNSYAIGAVVGGLSIGSLIGYNDINAAVINSYWDSDASGVEVSAGGTSKTSVELQSPTSTKSIYVGWSADNWAFGSQRTPKYPTLKYTEGNYNFDDDNRPNDIYGHATCGADLLLPDCGGALPDQGQPGSQGQLALRALILLTGVLEPPFDPTKTYYEILDIPEGQTEVTVIATANNDNATITIDEQSVSQAIVQLDAIGATTETGIHIVLTAMDQSAKHYTIVLPAQPMLSGAATAPCSEEDIDKDDDGLIEICDIEGLYAMRYQLDGTGYTASISASKVTAGCDEDDTMQCRGYELVQDLDFNDPADYRDSRNQTIWTVANYDDITDRGWRPIGSSVEAFNAVFRGNGYTLSNLAINRNDTDYVGLFGRTTGNVEITAIGLADVAVRGRFLVGGLVGANNGGTIEHSYVSGNVSGRDMIVGGLVGSHRGLINNSYVTGQVLGNRTVGGLVGTNNSANNNSTSTIINSYALNDVGGRTFVGGLVASNAGVLSNSYASGMVAGIIDAGGLAGLNVGNITNSYARGDVSGSDNVGGLVGDNRAFVGNSYASGMVSGDRFVGGLVGSGDSTLIERSYWDVNTSMQMTSAGGISKTTVELQSPTAPGMSLMEIYYGWSTRDWDFSGGRYPVLKYIVGDDDTKPACDDDTSDEDNTDLPPCGTVLFSQTPLAITGDIGGAEADEGDTLVLDVSVSDGSGNYSYQWTQILQTADHLSGKSILTLTGITTPSLNVEIPADFIAPNAESADITFKVVVSDGVTTTSRSQVVTISKIDNGLPNINFSGTNRMLSVTVNVGSDPDGAATVSEYQWQQLPPTPGSQWQTNETIVTEDNMVNYEVPADTSTRTRFSVLVTLSDGQNHTTTTRIGDYIYGGNSPIDIYTLEDLNAIRYQPAASYQLRADLDFNEPNSYTNISNMDQWAANDDRTNAGWLPIPFYQGVFDGNGHTISNLYINQPTKDTIGLFAIILSLGNPAEIKNVGLLNVDIQGQGVIGGLLGLGNLKIVNSYVTGNVKGDSIVGGLIGGGSNSEIISSFTNVDITGNQNVGGLAGQSGNLTSNSYALGSVTGNTSVGGLAGDGQGLVVNSYASGEVNGDNNTGGLIGIAGETFMATIINSYASGEVNGKNNTGGLVGFVDRKYMATIINSYASGVVNGENNTGGLIGMNGENNTGGLVGIINNSTSTIINSYASGEVYGESNTGGLIGITMGPTVITASYWDVDTSMQTTSAGGTSKTTVELQSPIAPGATSTEVYYGWSIRDWEFGDNRNYPALRYAAGPDEDACNTDVTTPSALPQCGILLSGQHGRDRGLAAVFFLADGGDEEVTIEVNAPFSPLVFEYDITIPNPDITAVQLKPFAINDNATITITKQSDDSAPNYFANKANDELSAPISLDHQTTLTIVITDTIDDRTDNTTYTFAITRVMPLGIAEIAVNPSGVIDEGSNTTITFTVSGGLGEYKYAYELDGEPLPSPSQPLLQFTIPTNIVDRDRATQTIEVNITVNDGIQMIEHSLVLTVRKVDNGGSFNITFEADSSQLRIIGEEDDPDGDGHFSYQWQQLELGDEWRDIAAATTPTYWLPADTDGRIRYRVNIQHTDGQGYISNYQQGSFRTGDIDDDDDGLIDIYYLEDLNALHYQLDGSGYQMNLGDPISSQGCPATGCIGYELRRSLDFADDASYSVLANQAMWTPNTENKEDATNLGWLPIGLGDSSFNSVFEGNGHTISNLYIKAESRLGLFSALHANGRIQNVGLLDVNVEGTGDNIGGLIGLSNLGSVIINSYVTGNVTGMSDDVGGLVGDSGGSIINSYAKGVVTGSNSVGGLVGWNADSIINSYATGVVTGIRVIGGLVGGNINVITNSYATGVVTGDSRSGGLVGFSDRGTITASYWDTEESEIMTSAAGIGKTTVELQSPIAPGTISTEVYYGWSIRDWEFGDNRNYPALRYAAGGDEDACNADVTAPSDSLQCGILLSGQHGRDRGLAAVFFLADGGNEEVTIEVTPLFSSLTVEYKVTIPNPDITAVQLKLFTINDNATITITKQSDDPAPNYFANKANDELSALIALDDQTTLTIVVTDTIGERTDNTTYTFAITRLMPIQMSEITISSQPSANNDGTINEGSDVTLSFDVTGGRGNYEYVYLMDDAPLMRSNTQPFVYKIAEDFLSADVDMQNVTFKVIVHDGAFITSRSEVLTIRKIDNGSPDIELDVSPARLSIRSVSADPDGEGTFTYIWQKRDITDTSWITIDDATTATYNLPERASGSIRYRVDVKYVDGQGYGIDYSKGAQRKSFILMPLRADIDIDDDGLIEIYYLEDLDATRYQLDGTAYKANADAAVITTGCPDRGSGEVCNGYELARSLDFNNVASYTDSANRDVWYTNAGWQPIGTVAEQNFFNIQNNQINGFASLLEGNGHTLSNLSIDIKAINDIPSTIRGIGLFGYITRSASVRNIGLLNVNIQNNNTLDVSDNYRPYGLGGLVGMNDGTVINSYVTGTVNGDINLFRGREFVGGLVGNNLYKIINSYADVWVVGYKNVGGLVGENCHWHPGSCRITERLETAGQIINSYASGAVNYDNDVSGSIYEGNGGLVGANRYIINNSYTRVTTNSSQFNLYGGLVGANSAPSRDVIESDPSRNTKPIITASHWEKPNESDIPDIRGDVALTYSGAGRSTNELQAATKPGSTSTEVYYNWSVDDWDFGTSKQYPILRYAGGDVSACAEEAPESEIDRPQCGTFLQNQGIGLRNLDLSPRHGVIWDTIFNSERTGYTVSVHFSLSELDLNLQSYNSNAIINIGGGDNAVGSTSATISLDALTSLIIEVDDRVIDEETDTFSTTKTTYTIALNKLPKLMILDVSVDAEEPVDEGAEITLIPTVTTSTGSYRYRVEIGEQPLAVLNQDAGSVTIQVPDDLIAADADVGSTTFTIIVEDGFSTASFDKAVMIMKQNNGEPTVGADVNGSQIEIFLSDDPDGAVTTAGYIWQKRDISDAEWMAIAGATSSDYNIPQASPGGALYQVLVTYTDAQGYGTDTNDLIILGPFRAADKDDDNDNLIDIYYLEDLDAIRNIYGDMPAICGTDADQSCNGFALRRSLDFNNPSHYETMEINSAWTTTPGWQPIGDIDNPFTSTFIATTSSLTISHLLIDRPTQNNVALFGVIGEMSGTNGRISNIHLRAATVTGRFAVGGLAGLTHRSSLIINSSVVGTMAATDAWVGVMVGSNYGAIINSYADGNVQGKSIVGGLAGYSFGPISNSYAHSHVISRDYGGGLVGYNHNEKQFEGGGNIINSYATGSVEGVFHVGGLVGYNDDGAINDAYALGNVIGSIHVGGLVGSSGSSGTIVNVYASSRVVGSGSVGDLVGFYDGEVAELATTPTLVYVAGPDSYSNETCGGEQLPACGTTLPGQDRAGSVGALALQNLTLSSGVLEPPFDPTKTYYEILDLAPGQTDVTVTATANNNNATITIGGQSVLPTTLQLEDIGETTQTGLSIVLTAMAQSTKHYTIVLPAQPKLSEQASVPCSEDDIDKDDDGLIEICDLEGLYAMRYQLDGSGYTTRTNANKITTGCGNNHCRGYELVRDLDFNNSAHYRNSNNQPIWTVTDYGDSSDRGWRPIGTFVNPFNAIFEANGHIISNLSSNRNDSDYVGLFGHLSSNAEINAIGLLDMNVRGRFIVGGLVGWNEQGIITNSYLSGNVIAREAWVGGLAGDNVGFITNSYASGAVVANRVVGGLVGINIGRISNSHAENTVEGRAFIGGLAGINVNEIRNSYTTGAVQESIYYAGGLASLNTGRIENSYAIGNIMGGERVGGLVGDNRNLIAYSYAIGTVLGSRLVGGLVGINSGIITDSYATREHELTGFEFDNVGMTIRSSIVSVADLQSPRPGWNTNDWNFVDGKYPALKYTGEYGECENPPPDTAIPNCNTLLDGQFPMLLALTAAAPAKLSKTGDFTYSLRIAVGANMVTLTPTADDDNATIHYIVDNEAETAAMNTTPFTVTLPENAQTITITLESPDQTISSIQYTVNIERVIFTHIRVFLEGLLQ